MSLIVENWGMVDYMQAYQRQRQLVDALIEGASPRLIFCEHPPVLTLGRLTREDSLLCPREHIVSKGIQIYPIDRGGDVTLHAPGQQVVYPIIHLDCIGRNLKTYLEKLEQVAVDLLKDFDILAVSLPGKRGVFMSGPGASKEAKIVSIGIGVRKWVAFHGLGINVNTDLSLFDVIKPCGLDVQMTSMQKILGKPIPMADVRASIIKQFQKEFVIAKE